MKKKNERHIAILLAQNKKYSLRGGNFYERKIEI